MHDHPIYGADAHNAIKVIVQNDRHIDLELRRRLLAYM
jgi:hypothetical protein